MNLNNTRHRDTEKTGRKKENLMEGKIKCSCKIFAYALTAH